MLLDTNAYTALTRDDSTVSPVVASVRTIHMSPTVIGELYAGFFGGSRQVENERKLEAFLQQSFVSILSFDTQTGRTFGELYSFLRRQGTLIPVNAVWIGALAVQHSLPLLTLDGHFGYLPQITLVPVKHKR